MTAKDLAEQLTVIADHAKVLRDAGVVGRVNVADVSFELGESLGPSSSTAPDAQPQNPLDDPETFGGHIPQRRVFVAPQAPTDNNDDDD